MTRLLLCLALLVLPGFAAADDEPGDEAAVVSGDLSTYSKDDLFAKLASADAESAEAKRVESEILRRFHRSGSETVDLLFARALEALNARDYALCLDLLDEIILLRPDFAEAWNKRATIHFLERDYGRSIADIRETLAREPRHFGALAGLGMILESLGRKEEALKALQRALALNPRLDTVRETAEALEKEIAGRSI